MTALAPTLEAFFSDRLIKQRGSGPNTIAAYRDTFRLLIAYTTNHTNTSASDLDIGQLDAALIGGFSTTSKPKGTTAPPPATPASPRSDRSTDTLHDSIPNTPS